MKKQKTTLKAFALSLAMAFGMLFPTTMNAQSDGFFRGGNDNYEDRGININSNPGGITNDDFGAPLGSGLLIMVAAGAGYAAMRRRRGNVTRRSGRDVARRVPTMVLAVALLLGMTNCKKKVETINSIPESEGIHITLSLDNGSRAEVDPPHVSFKGGDQIIVVSDGKYMGVVTANQDGDNIVFSGDLVSGTPASGEPLYFYFLGNNGVLNEPVNGDVTGCTATIIDQTGYPTLPVISMAPSNETYPSSDNNYTASLHNKASLMKFNVTTDSDAAICIIGMNNRVTVDFGDPNGATNGFTYDQVDGGLIKLKGGSGSPAVKWAIVLPQDALTTTGEAYSEDNAYTGTRPTIHAIEANKYYHEGSDVINMAVNTTTTTTTTVTWINSHIKTISLVSGQGEIYDGIEVQLDDDLEESSWDGTDIYLSEMGMLTFQIYSDGDYAEYDIKKIEIYYSSFSGNLPEGGGWSNDGSKLTWDDGLNWSVILQNQGPEPNNMSITVTQVVFTLEKSAK